MLTPIENNIIVNIAAIETTTESGLYIPETAIKAPSTAEVVAVSADNEKVVAGDQLLIRQHAGMPFEYDGDQYHLIHLHDIIAVIK